MRKPTQKPQLVPNIPQTTVDIALDPKLLFADYKIKVCKKASQKLNVLARLASHWCQEKQKTVMKTFLTSQFEYYSLV